MSKHSALSVLIPIFNFPVLSLVKTLHQQAKRLELEFEILCYDDGSTDGATKELNNKLADLAGVVYKEFKQNKGRSQIRNLLAKESKYENLLFIDSDSRIVNNDFLQIYMEAAKECEVVAGGTVYIQQPQKEFSLRYYYGKSREELSAEERSRDPYKNLCLNNTLIRKKLFVNHLLDENILKYGHEDTKFALSLKKSMVNICHIDNAVEHIGLEENAVFLSKTKDGVANFLYLSNEGIVNRTKLYRSFKLLQATGLSKLFIYLWNLGEKPLMKNLHSSHPSIFLFDLYKLQLLLKLNKGNRNI